MGKHILRCCTQTNESKKPETIQLSQFNLYICLTPTHISLSLAQNFIGNIGVECSHVIWRLRLAIHKNFDSWNEAQIKIIL